MKFLCFLIITLSLSVGCGDKTKGISSGRVGIHETTAAEASSGKILIGDLASASIQIAEQFVVELNDLVLEEWDGYRVTLIVGDMDNKTTGRARVSTADFEYVQDRILSQLISNKTFRNNVKVTRKSSRIERLKNREGIRPGNLLDANVTAGSIDRGNEEYVYFLNSDMYTINRGSTSLYFLKFTVDNASDGAIIFAGDYEVKYQ
jgi:hypothetical protein